MGLKLEEFRVAGDSREKPHEKNVKECLGDNE